MAVRHRVKCGEGLLSPISPRRDAAETCPFASPGGAFRGGQSSGVEWEGLSMPKTIVVVANVYPPRFIGGAELVAHRHACIIRDAGHRVIVFAGEARPASARHSVVQDTYEGLQVHRVQLKAVDYS